MRTEMTYKIKDGPKQIFSKFQKSLAQRISGRELAKKYAACRTNPTKAAAKLHLLMSVLSGSPRRVKLTAERVGDSPP